MNPSPWRTTTIGMAAICLLTVSLGVIGARYFFLALEVEFATDQSTIFDDLRQQALASQSPDVIRGCINGVETYYPSGTKQRAGSAIDRMVERHRAAVIREIQAHLAHIEAR